MEARVVFRVMGRALAVIPWTRGITVRTGRPQVLLPQIRHWRQAGVAARQLEDAVIAMPPYPLQVTRDVQHKILDNDGTCYILQTLFCMVTSHSQIQADMSVEHESIAAAFAKPR